MKLLCIDGNSIVNRAFYGIKLLTTKSGRYTNAVYGFMNVLLKLEQEEKPDAVAVAFDLPAPTFRHKMYDGYKAGRHRMPEELAQQLPVLKELLGDLGYQMVTAEGFEADDILGTLAASCRGAGAECVIATGDRDSYQLVGGGVKVLLTTTKFGKGETNAVTEEVIREQFGLEPVDLIQVKALQGDTSDNIPGVPGVGEKTALELIRNFKTVEGVYANIDSDKIRPGVRAKLLAGRQSAEMSLELARIATDAPIPLKAEDYRKKEGDPEAAARLLAELEMASLLERLALQAPPPAPQEEAAPLREVQPQELPEKMEGRVCLFQDGERWIAVQGERVFSAEPGGPAFASLLSSKKAEKWVFDAKPLYHLALELGCKAQNITFDGKLAAYLLNPSASSYGVKALAAEYQVQPAFSCPQEGAGVVEPLMEELARLCEEQGMTRLLAEIELPLAAVLAEMEHLGFLVDTKGIRAFGDALQDTLQSSLAGIYREVGYEFNVNSPKQLGEALFGKLGLPPRKKTKSGYSTDAETLESLREYSPVVEDILQYRTYQKLNSTYVEGLLKQVEEDGRIHSHFNQTETRTGRISSDEPNLQNIPVRTELGSQLRKFFTAREGCVLLDADYSQIELRILAHVSEDEAMIEAFRTGADIHRSTAARIFGLPPEMVTPQLRSRAKAVNFGIVYGIGAFSLAKNTGVSVKEADQFIKNYLTTFSGVKAYMEHTIAFGEEHGYVETMYGRRRALPELRSSNRNVRALGERLAMNTPIQGTAADIIKLAMVRVSRRLAEEGLRAKLVLQVHDELIVEAPLEEQEQAARILGEEMEGAARLRVPLTADVHSGPTWYAAKG